MEQYVLFVSLVCFSSWFWLDSVACTVLSCVSPALTSCRLDRSLVSLSVLVISIVLLI